MIGANDATEDDLEDIFNLLDINGDETLDRKEFQSLIKVFFKVLTEKDIEIHISNDTDII